MSSRTGDGARAFRRKSLLIDSNLLLLFIVGLCDPARIVKFKRTAQFTVDDFECLKDFVGQFKAGCYDAQHPHGGQQPARAPPDNLSVLF